MNSIKNVIRLLASPKSVITSFLSLPGDSRVSNVVNRVADLDQKAVDDCINKLKIDFDGRHRNIEETFLNHFHRIEQVYGKSLSRFSQEKKIILGAFFTKEYSIQAAALFNPSIVSHPDQQGLQAGELRFLMSLRATGEGHISSIIFKTGVIDQKGTIVLDKESGYFNRLHKNDNFRYSKDFIFKRAVLDPRFDKSMLDDLPSGFTASELLAILKVKTSEHSLFQDSASIIEEILDSNYDLEAPSFSAVTENVLFPTAKVESMGMEDARFVKFEGEAESVYYGTYTAYDGNQIRTQLIETNDFLTFKIRSLYGSAISDKGMALFPQKLNGKYVMISRQGGEKIHIMFSEDLYCWEHFQVLMEPRFVWELVQLGNCGSPIKTKKGWLLLTHGVGILRTYIISLVLLDLQDPTRIIGRLDRPLIEADETERDGYVPNVVYTCGFLRLDDLLVIPYAVSDSAIGFRTFSLNEIFDGLKS